MTEDLQRFTTDELATIRGTLAARLKSIEVEIFNRACRSLAQQEPVSTPAALARVMGVNRATITRWLRRADWPFEGAPWSGKLVVAIARWAAVNVRWKPQTPTPRLGSESKRVNG